MDYDRTRTMFDAHCDRCATVVLLGPRRIVDLEHTDDGIVVTYRCYCGEVGREVTGRRASRAPAEPDRHDGLVTAQTS